MKTKLGVCCMMLGALLMLGSLGLLVYNQKEAAEAERVSAAVMPVLMDMIQQERETEPTEPPVQQIPEALRTAADLKMSEVEVDGHTYIGCLCIPALNLELPIMSDWSYGKLRVAPCRYSGTVLGGDLVLMAHNYKRHFGTIARLSEGERVYFTDVDGVVSCYEVMALDVLDPGAVEEMTAGDFDLTLFTCTYGGQSRVTVFCDRVEL